MFFHDQEFGPEQMDKILIVSNNAFAPMVGYICKKSDMAEGIQSLKDFYVDEAFTSEMAKFKAACTDEALEKDIAETIERMKADYKKRSSRLAEIEAIIASGNVINEDITGMTAEELARRENGNRAERRSVDTPKGQGADQ
jgi:hypothetical protein